MRGNTKDKRRSRKVAAILAGGLVVGIGTMATLASWSDPEYASNTFTAGSFNMMGSLDGSAFTDSNTSPGKALAFTTGFNNISPTDVVAAPFAVRLDQVSTYGANVTLVPSSTTTITGLTYQVLTTTSFGCTTSTTGTTLIAAGTALNSGSGAFTLTKPANSTTQGAAVNLCFKVTADNTLTQAATGTVTWKFTATSS